MISTKKKKKARKGVRDSWGTVGQGKLVILNKMFRKGFTKEVKERALQITRQGTLQLGVRECQDIKWETRLAYPKESVEIQSNG